MNYQNNVVQSMIPQNINVRQMIVPQNIKNFMEKIQNGSEITFLLRKNQSLISIDFNSIKIPNMPIPVPLFLANSILHSYFKSVQIEQIIHIIEKIFDKYLDNLQLNLTITIQKTNNMFVLSLQDVNNNINIVVYENDLINKINQKLNDPAFRNDIYNIMNGSLLGLYNKLRGYIGGRIKKSKKSKKVMKKKSKKRGKTNKKNKTKRN